MSFTLRKRRLLHGMGDTVYIVDRSAEGKQNIERLTPINEAEAVRLCAARDADVAAVHAQRDAANFKTKSEGA